MSCLHRPEQGYRIAAAMVLALFLTCLSCRPAAAQPSTPHSPQIRLDGDGNPLPEGAITRLGTTRFRSQQERPYFLVSPDGRTIALEDQFRVALLDASTGAVRHYLSERTACSKPLAFSADGRLLATLSCSLSEAWLRVWDTTTGHELWSHRELEITPISGHFSADGKTFLTLHSEEAVYLWEARSGKTLRRLPLVSQSTLFNTALTPDGKRLAAPLDRCTIRVQELPGGRVLRTFPRQQSPLTGAVFSPDGKLLAAKLDAERCVRLWNVETGKEVRVKISEEDDRPLVFSSDGGTLLTGHRSEECLVLSIWDTADGKLLWSLGTEDRVGGLALSPDGRWVALHEEDKLVLRQLRSGKRFWGAGQLAWSYPECTLAFSADGKRVIASDEHRLRFWETDSGREKQAAAHTGPVGALAFSGDGLRLAVGCRDSILVWQTSTGKRAATVGAHAVLGALAVEEKHFPAALALCRTGQTLAFAGSLGETRVQMRDVQTGQRLQVAGPCRRFILAPAGQYLATQPDHEGKIELRSTATGALRRTLEPDAWPEDFAFSPQEPLLAILENGGVPPAISLWDVEAGRRLGRFPTAEGLLVFSGDGRVLAVHEPSEGKVSLWELASGKEVHRFSDPSCQRVAFTASGQVVAAGVGEQDEGSEARKMVVVWDVLAGKKLSSVRVPGAHIQSIALAADGSRLATALADTSVLIWQLPSPANRGSKLDNKDLERLWTDLGSSDARQAFQAVRRLVAVPEPAVALLKTHLRPAAVSRLSQQIADLDADDFATREAATKELTSGGSETIVALHAALTHQPSLEARKRIERLLAQLQGLPLPPHLAQQVRAVQVLEYAATPVSRRLLHTLAQGWQDALLTREARGSLQRLAQRPAPLP
jgi:WD40 repeat protein